MANFGNVFHNTPVKKPDAHPRKDIKWIHYTKLKESPYQYRDKTDKERRRENIISLALLIDADNGVIEPLLVRKSDADEYEIIAGHTRRDACKYLVEEETKKQYEFLPCIVEKLGDVQAEWQAMSSNGYQEKTDYEKMYEIRRKKELLEQHPEEFPNLQTGRMVERLAKQLNMKQTTVGEYLTISKNLGEQGMEAFKSGELKKSAAVELSALPKEEQKELLEQGVTSHKEIKAYKAEKEEPIKAVPKERKESHTEPEPQLPGQMKIINTDMEITEDILESGTNESKKEDVVLVVQDSQECYTPQYFLKEQQEKLEYMLEAEKKGVMLPERALKRQEVIVDALKMYVLAWEQ